MNKYTTIFALTFITLLDRSATAQDADVMVYGATPGGIAAAVSAAKGGQRVVLVEPTERIGGLLTSGLSYSDFRTFESLSGFFLNFSKRVEADYAKVYGANSDQVKASWRGTHGEPAVNLRVLESMLSEFPKLRVLKQHRLNALTLSPLEGGRRRILSATFRTSTGSAQLLNAKMFIDGSYEGDLMAMAGENYHVGRESRDQYGEPMAGNKQGQADGQVQGYNLRFIMTHVDANKRTLEQPPNYNRNDFTGALQHFTSGKLTKVFSANRDGIFRAHMPHMPNGKTDMNDTPRAPVRLSMPDINDAYPEGDLETRQRIFDQHLYYNVGLLYFLQNDPAVPEAIQADARSWGLCKDEFPETDGLPPQLYIREARRLVGQHIFTGNDTVQVPGDARGRLHTDSIAIGDYVHNCHGTGRSGTRYNGEHTGEFYSQIPPYQIPYGVIVPQKTENLLVPVACSASHFGFGALRLEPIWSSLGQAAGWAANLALGNKSAVQDVDVSTLQDTLHRDRSATIYVSDVAPDSPDFAAIQWFGTRGGLHGLEPDGQPDRVSIGGQYSKALPGHTVQLDQPLSPELRKRWQTLITVSDPETPRNRQEWIREAYRNHL
jgi:hypothetical protein